MSAQAQSPARFIYLAASKLRDPVARAEYLDEACGSDLKLRKQLDQLLEADEDDADSPLQAAIEELGHDSIEEPDRSGTTNFVATSEASTDRNHVDETVDARVDASRHPVIGRYKLLEELGRGGMGAVYMAQQSEPVKRKVALKIIKPGMDSREVIARFQAERQALAMMDHPNIARVLDAGTTDEGRPYFVMELVRGIPITKFCEQKKLDLPERLKLFIDVCKAVQHAHQKAIIHRDLKPSNILVTLHDGEPVVKVIDFGVAKALNQDLTDQTLFTQFSQMIGTPLYMSPEQAEVSGLDVDTRSDIYALGVVLYELLTGTTPIERGSLAKLGYDAVRKLVLEQEPERPSSRISTLKAGVDSTVVVQKGQESKVLAKQLSSEVDWIVMKALEKDRTRRYETANGLAADVQRYLDGEAVQACPPSVVYRFRKSFRQNRTVLLTSALVLSGILVGAGLAVWKAIEADAERATANRQRELADQSFEQSLGAVEQMLQRVAGETLVNTPETIRVRRQLYNDAIDFYQNLRKLRPTDQRVFRGLASTYEAAGQIDYHTQEFDRGLASYDEALEIRSFLRDLDPANPKLGSDLAECMRLKASMLSEMRKPEDASTLCEQAVALMNGNPDRVQWAYCMCELALVRFRQNRIVEAEKIGVAANAELFADEKQELTESNWENVVVAFGRLARIQQELGKVELAQESFTHAIAFARRAVEKQFDISNSMHLLRMDLTLRGMYYHSIGNPELALVDLHEAWNVSVKHTEKFPASRGLYWFRRCGQSLVQVYQRLGRGEEAQAFANDFRPQNGGQAYALAMVLKELGEESGYETNMRRALASDVANETFVRTDFGLHQYSVGNWPDSIKYLTPRHGNPTQPGWNALAHAHFESEQFASALAYLQRGWEEEQFVFSPFVWIPPERLAACDDEGFRQGYLKLIDKATRERGKSHPGLYLLRIAAHVAFEREFDEEAFKRDLQTASGGIETLLAISNPSRTEIDKFSESLEGLSYAQRVCFAVHQNEFGQQLLELFIRLIETTPDGPYAAEGSNLPYHYYQVALLSLIHDGEQTYRDICRRMHERFKGNSDATSIHWLPWTCSLGPDAMDDFGELRAHAEGVLDDQANGRQLLPYWGAVLYRAGEFKQAASILEGVVTRQVENSSTTYFRYFLAMAQHKLGNLQQATEHLAQANIDAEKELAGNPIWNRKLTLELLRHEAEQLFESKEKNQSSEVSSSSAVEEESTL